MKKWKKWKSSNINQNYDAIIIGSGISGLTTGVFLSKNNKKVLILEKHFKAGGWTHTFKRKNYEWDVGIHYIGEVHKLNSPVRRLFDLVSNNKLEWNKMDENYDSIIFPDQQYNFTAPKEQFIENISKYFPGTEDKIIKYINIVKESVKSGLSFYSNKALPNWLSYISYSRMSGNFLKYSDQTTYEAIMKIFKDEQILGVLSGQWGDYGLPPKQSSFAMHASVVNHYLDGGNYPIGTSRRIAETAVDYIESMNGKVSVNADVDEIITHQSKAIGVRLSNGDEIFAPIIVSSAGVKNTYDRFLRNSFNHVLLKDQLNKVQPTGSYICLYMGLNKSAQDLKIKNTNLWIYPSYNHDQNLKNYLDNSTSDLPILYISFPSAKDPQYLEQYPNSATMEAITIAPWEMYKQWSNKPWKKRGNDYENIKEDLSQLILNQVYKHVPQIKHSIEYYELSTPLSVKSLANYSKGELYGIDHNPNRFRQRWLKPKSNIRNLYFTGQDIITVGVTSALFSGLLTASTILKKNLMSQVLKN